MCNTTELHASVMSAVSDGAGKPRAGGITLKLLIDEGILEPGENVLTVEYKSSMTSASLAADGRIHCAVSDTSLLFCAWELQVIPRIHCTKCHAIRFLEATKHLRCLCGCKMLQLCVTLHCCKIVQVAGRNMTFESPSAFSIFLKRLVNPARKADDGWKTVKYNGRFLEQFKLELARRRLGMRSDDANSGTSLAVMSA